MQVTLSVLGNADSIIQRTLWHETRNRTFNWILAGFKLDHVCNSLLTCRLFIYINLYKILIIPGAFLTLEFTGDCMIECLVYSNYNYCWSYLIKEQGELLLRFYPAL